MKLSITTFFLLVSLSISFSQPITWEEQTNAGLPEGVRLYKGIRSAPKLQAFYLDVDLNRKDLAIRPYKFSSSAIVPSLTDQVGAYAAVNGGFFGGTTSYSSVISPGEIPAINVKSLTRDSQSYPVIRSLFSIDTTGAMSVDWIYHFDQTLDGLYKFDQPMAYGLNDPTPMQAPVKGDGIPFPEVLVGIGGGPTLVRDGLENITYNEEIFWGSGVGYDNGDPRTGVGFRNDGHVILLVADGRQTISEGVSLPEMAQIFLELGCVEAMNLDGGGSTQMAIGNQYVNLPSEQRAVPTILAVVHYDSLGLPKEPLIEKIGDTGDTTACNVVGEWFETANEGYWGDSKAILNAIGNGSDYVEFRPQLGAGGTYELYAWWVASNDNFRSRNCPFIIHHNNGIDTVYADQTANGSTWNRMGSWYFRGDTSDAVIISDAAKDGPYVMADAIRLVTYDTSSATRITQIMEPVGPFRLYQNYPNPFNNGTIIKYSVGTPHAVSVPQRVELTIFNILGQKIKTLVSENQPAGNYAVHWDASNVPSGVYYYQLNVESSGFDVVRQSGKMILLQ